jgi:hypothetical protein
MNREIEHPTAYDAAIRRNIWANANKTFRAQNADWAVLVAALEEGIESPGVYKDGFMGSLAQAYAKYGRLTEGQANAIRKGIAKRAEQRAEWIAKRAAEGANKDWVGEAVGEKITITVTTKKVIEGFGTYGAWRISILHDVAGNILVYRGMSAAIPEEGGTATIKATVKERATREGIKQTVIARPSTAS